MMTDWKDPEINPLGLTHEPQHSSLPMRVAVPVEVRALTYFTSKDGQTYLCAFIDEVRRRVVFKRTDHGFVEEIDPDIIFTVARMTDEIIEAQRV